MKRRCCYSFARLLDWGRERGSQLFVEGEGGDGKGDIRHYAMGFRPRIIPGYA